jgi:hypothetical protein
VLNGVAIKLCDHDGLVAKDLYDFIAEAEVMKVLAEPGHPHVSECVWVRVCVCVCVCVSQMLVHKVVKLVGVVFTSLPLYILEEYCSLG